MPSCKGEADAHRDACRRNRFGQVDGRRGARRMRGTAAFARRRRPRRPLARRGSRSRGRGSVARGSERRQDRQGCPREDRFRRRRGARAFECRRPPENVGACPGAACILAGGKPPSAVRAGVCRRRRAGSPRRKPVPGRLSRDDCRGRPGRRARLAACGLEGHGRSRRSGEDRQPDAGVEGAGAGRRRRRQRRLPRGRRPRGPRTVGRLARPLCREHAGRPARLWGRRPAEPRAARSRGGSPDAAGGLREPGVGPRKGRGGAFPEGRGGGPRRGRRGNGRRQRRRRARNRRSGR